MTTTADLQARLAALSPEKRRRLRASLERRGSSAPDPGLKLSIFFFSDRGSESGPLYDMLLSCARIADQGGLYAVWTPERHFNEFGGPYPEPSLLGAALAMATRRIRIRAGSVVLPLNDTIRVAERWSVVDNLSGGRVGIALASGWHPDDFVLSRAPYQARHQQLAEQHEVLERLWRLERVALPGPDGKPVDLRIYPAPVQPRLPIWFTTSKQRETWLLAARRGGNVLTGLLEQSVDQVAEHIAAYRAERERAGHDPAAGQVTLMLHSYVSAPGEDAEETVVGPLGDYLRSHMRFYETMMRKKDLGVDVDSLTEEDKAELVQRGVRRYVEQSSLIGDPARCRETMRRLRAVGVDELACLINFGLPDAIVTAGVERLAALQGEEAIAAATGA